MVVKKKEETNGKGDMPPSGLMKHPQRDFHLDCKKEYQHSRYMDSPLHSALLVGGTAALTEVSQRINLSVIVYLKGCLFSVNLVSWRMCFCHLTNLPVTASVLCSILTPGRSKSRTWQKLSSITQMHLNLTLFPKIYPPFKPMKRLSILSLTIFESYEKITRGLWEWQMRSLIWEMTKYSCLKIACSQACQTKILVMVG